MHFTDERPFLEAIFARDADDRPRLVYADFLDDCGEPERAELVRVQLALARLSDDDPRRPELSDRQAELLTRNRAAWTAHLAGLVVGVDFRRGVPDSVTVEAATFLARGAELFERLRVRRLRLLDVSAVAAKLAASPLLAGVRELDLCNADLGGAGLAALARSPHLARLEALDLGFNGLDDDGVTALAVSSGFADLAALALNDNDRISGDGLKALAESPFFAGLTALDVSGNDINEHGLRALAASANLPRLRAFRAHGNSFGDAGLAALVGSPLFARMVKTGAAVELRANAIGAAGAAALASCPALAGCAALDLSTNYLGDAGLAALLRSRNLGALRVLRLARNQITDAGIAAARDLLDSLLDRVAVLDLSNNRLTRVGLSILSAVRGARAARVEVGGNVQTAPAGDAPVAVADPIDGVIEAARLRHRITNPRAAAEGEP
ncbi:MAG: TIGR02996 domain-containing protein [Planctomycetes bacterium]|nr:TIGR02996 domain-containing protein [Planctomycetota bacterium]